jgi:hypothetical protein
MSDRLAAVARFAPVLLVLAIAAAVVLGSDERWTAAGAGGASTDRVTATLDALPDDAVVLVGFDPDVGTYPEIRPTVRTLLADLLARRSTLALVSLTPEGRALASAELARIDALEANPRQLVDLGWVPGAEAAIVALANELAPGGSDPITTVLPAGEEVAPDALVVVGGNDLGPRAWVEQFAPRVTELPIVAVAPSVLLPDLQPYLESGQLSALLGTPHDGAAYRDAAEVGRLERLLEAGDEPSVLPILVGLAVALFVLGHGLVAAGRLAGGRGREAA